MKVIAGWGQLRKWEVKFSLGSREMEGKNYLGDICNQYLIVWHIKVISVLLIARKAILGGKRWGGNEGGKLDFKSVEKAFDKMRHQLQNFA